MRIGIFGGSFDPIHHGHLIAAACLAEALELDQVRLVVARAQPLKRTGHGAAAADRAEMVGLAVRGDPRLRADRSELDREGPSYTVDTLRALRTGLPRADLVLLLGSDAAAELPRWHEADAIPSLARIEVFARGDAAAGSRTVPRVDISSTEVRDRVRRGRSIRYWVPDAVADYIAARRLYEEE